MPLKILADESLDFRIISELRSKDFEVISVLENYRSASDKKVLELARKSNAILITEDSDFGEWVFAHKEKNVSVVFLRYNVEQIKAITSSLIKLLTTYDAGLLGKFVVVTVQKIRMREVF